MRELRHRIEKLERRIGLRRSNVIATWADYGRAIAEGTLGDATLTPDMQREVRALLTRKLQEFVRSRGRHLPESRAFGA